MACTALSSICSALSARYSLTEVPWLRFLRNPDSLGGWPSIRRHAWWVFVWVLASCAVSTLLICTIQLGGIPLAKKFYNYVYHEDAPGLGEIHLLGLILITVVGHFLLTRRTYHYVRKQQEALPIEYITGESTSGTSVRRRTLTDLGKLLYYLVPSMLAPIYKHFYQSTGPIIDGCAYLLVVKYTENMLVSFYKHHRHTHHKDSDLLTLNQDVDGSSQIYKPHIIATGLIRLYGFGGAEQHINQYKEFLRKKGTRVNEETQSKKQRVARHRLLNELVCRIAWESGSGVGRVVQISENGSGAYVTHSLETMTFSKNQQICLTLEDITITGTSVHASSPDGEEHTNGDSYAVGLHIRRIEDQSRFAAVVDARRK